MNGNPRVSVVIAAYNVEAYVEAAVRSILEQSYTDFELIVIDDGSTDGTWAVLARLAEQDGRMRIERNVQNLGIARTRNRGTELARGEYIAVMDADDISLPERLAKQVAYLDAHPEVGVVGGAIRFVQGEDIGASHIVTYPLLPVQNYWHLHFGPSVVHSASMMRRILLLEVSGYRPEYRVAEDYDLWERMSHVTRLANLPDEILHVRRHGENITVHCLDQIDDLTATVSQRLVNAMLDRQLPLEEVIRLSRSYVPEPHTVSAISKQIVELVQRFRASNPLTPAEWQLVKQDAARLILRLLTKVPLDRDDARCFLIALRLDPIFTARWLRYKLHTWATRSVSARDKSFALT